jgi:hypothetical protein
MQEGETPSCTSPTRLRRPRMSDPPPTGFLTNPTLILKSLTLKITPKFTDNAEVLNRFKLV